MAETVAQNTDNKTRRQCLKQELNDVRSMIRALREAAETAQSEHGVTFELERAEAKEVRLLGALAALDTDPD